MTIFIDNDEMTDKRATKFISKPDDLLGQIVRTWRQSNIKHCFKNKSGFDKAAHRNRKTLKSMARDKIDMLFTSSNHLFSTQATDREETLYFEDEAGAAKRTGRLRQQHPKGPLAKIDKKPRTHRFLSEKRFECLKERMSKWHDNEGRLPRFYSYEKRAKDGKHHIEFSGESKKWHLSEGTVKTSKHDLDRRTASALENVIGIRSTKIKK
jgi:hypothetical protein